MLDGLVPLLVRNHHVFHRDVVLEVDEGFPTYTVRRRPVRLDGAIRDSDLRRGRRLARGTIVTRRSGGRPSGGEPQRDPSLEREVPHQRACAEVTRGEPTGHEGEDVLSVMRRDAVMRGQVHGGGPAAPDLS